MSRARGAAERVAEIGVLTGLALVLSLVERMFPPPVSLAPGIKLGLANVVVLILLYGRGVREALTANGIRVLMMGLIFTSPQTLLYSAVGAALSFLVMVLLGRLGCFSILGVSVAGAVFHNLGQLLMAAWIVRTPALFAYLPVLLAAGVVTGLLMGLVARSVLRHLPRFQTRT